jgi:hypothetical protein
MLKVHQLAELCTRLITAVGHRILRTSCPAGRVTPRPSKIVGSAPEVLAAEAVPANRSLACPAPPLWLVVVMGSAMPVASLPRRPWSAA